MKHMKVGIIRATESDFSVNYMCLEMHTENF